jgi:hypothetical protein
MSSPVVSSSGGGGSTPRATKLREYVFPRPIVGAYATSPPTSATARAPGGDETTYYAGLRALPTFGGFEVPLLPGNVLHAEDEPWLIQQLIMPPCERVVLTLIPATAVANESNPAFGLASTDSAGRAAAVELVRAACAAAARVNAAAGRVLVHGVEVHSAPSRHRGGDSSEEAFAASLVEIAGMPWDGARIIVEHCDALPRGGAATDRTPAKGFMTLDEEFRAIEAANGALSGGEGAKKEAPGFVETRIFYGVNWARSVIETHDVDTPAAHFVAGMTDRRLLPGALIFSGCTGRADSLYGAWKDAHTPSSQIAAESLLTPAAVSAALVHWFTLDWNVQQAAEAAEVARSAPTASFLGVKIHLKKDGAITPAERIAANADALALIDRFLRVDEKQMGEAARETDADRACAVL